jgi:hypothetical protein
VFGPFENLTYIIETGSEESGPVVSKGSKLDALRSSTSARPARAFRRDGAKDSLPNFDHPHRRTALSQRSPLPVLGKALAYSGMPSFSNQFAVCCIAAPAALPTASQSPTKNYTTAAMFFRKSALRRDCNEWQTQYERRHGRTAAQSTSTRAGRGFDFRNVQRRS